MKVTSFQIRKTFGKILKKLQSSDEPIIIEKGRIPVAVLISIKTFKERFVDYREEKNPEELLALFRSSGARPSADSLKTLRELRYGRALIEKYSRKRLAMLGRTEPQLKRVPRRKFPPSK